MKRLLKRINYHRGIFHRPLKVTNLGNTCNRINNNSCSCVSKPRTGDFKLNLSNDQQTAYKYYRRECIKE